MASILQVNKTVNKYIAKIKFGFFALLAFALLQAVSPAAGKALSWQFSSLPDRERIVVTLDSTKPWSVSRVGKKALLINTGASPATTGSEAASGAKLFNTVGPAPKGLYLFTNTNAFGYTATSIGKNQVKIDIFSDPIGARWKGSGPEPTPPAGAASNEEAPKEKAANSPNLANPANPTGQATGQSTGHAIDQPTGQSTGQPIVQKGEASAKTQGQGSEHAAEGPSAGVQPQPQTQPHTQIDALIAAQNHNTEAAENRSAATPSSTVAPATGSALGPEPHSGANGANSINAAVGHAGALPQSQNNNSPQNANQQGTNQQGTNQQVTNQQGGALSGSATGQGINHQQAQNNPMEVPLADSLRSVPPPSASPNNNLPSNLANTLNNISPKLPTSEVSGGVATLPSAKEGKEGAQKMGQVSAATQIPQAAKNSQAGAGQNSSLSSKSVAPTSAHTAAQAPASPEKTSMGSVFLSTVINTGGPEDWAKAQSDAKNSKLPASAAGGKRGQVAQKGASSSVNGVVGAPESAAEGGPEGAAEKNATFGPVYKGSGPSGTFPVSRVEATPQSYPKGNIPPSAVDNATLNLSIPAVDKEKVLQSPAPPKAEELDNSLDNATEPVQLDEHGKPLPTVPEILREAELSLNGADYDAALKALEPLKTRQGLTDEQREDMLYDTSDALYGKGMKDVKTNGAKIIAASEEALNNSLKSPRVPAMMLRIGYVHLKMGNVQEAESFFNLLKRKYPSNENIPLIYYYWGEYFFENKKYQQAADQFQYIVQNYPDARFVREASIGLARSLYELGYYDQSFQIVDYIEKRWPRFYMEYPPILTMVADALFKSGKYDEAKARYLLFYNLAPSGPEAGTTLTRLGDIYLALKNKKAAREVYEEAARKFPDDDSGLIAMMRLAEESINDAPSMSDMFGVFDRPYTDLPLQVYTKIIKEHPNSQLAPLARLKLSMWYLWNKRYNDALREVEEFKKKYPGHPLLPKAKEVAMAAFSSLASTGIQDKEYDRVLNAWDQFDVVRGQEEDFSGESRLALAFSEWNSKRGTNALKTLSSFFKGIKDPTYGEPALNLALTILIDTDQWQQIADLYNKVAIWELSPDAQRQLDYSMALAAENLGKPDQATALWESLRKRVDLPPDQKAYMFYFLSKAAERKKDMETAYYLGKDALSGLMQIAEADPAKADKGKIKDILSSLMSITEGAGRVQEALDWQQQFAQQIKPDDPDYPSMRYRLGQLYKKAGDTSRWAVVMQDLADKFPTSLYGKMAASELNSNALSNQVDSFLPPSQ